MPAPHCQHPTPPSWGPGSRQSLGAAYGSHHPFGLHGAPWLCCLNQGSLLAGQGGEQGPVSPRPSLLHPAPARSPARRWRGRGRSPHHGEPLRSPAAAPATGRAAIAPVLRREGTGHVAAARPSATESSKLGLEERELGR